MDVSVFELLRRGAREPEVHAQIVPAAGSAEDSTRPSKRARTSRWSDVPSREAPEPSPTPSSASAASSVDGAKARGVAALLQSAIAGTGSASAEQAAKLAAQTASAAQGLQDSVLDTSPACYPRLPPDCLHIDRQPEAVTLPLYTRDAGELAGMRGTAAGSARCPPLYKLLRLGDPILAQWSQDAQWYAATITSITHGGYPNVMYKVSYSGYVGHSEGGLGIERVALRPGWGQQELQRWRGQGSGEDAAKTGDEQHTTQPCRASPGQGISALEALEAQVASTTAGKAKPTNGGTGTGSSGSVAGHVGAKPMAQTGVAASTGRKEASAGSLLHPGLLRVPQPSSTGRQGQADTKRADGGQAAHEEQYSTIESGALGGGLLSAVLLRPSAPPTGSTPPSGQGSAQVAGARATGAGGDMETLVGSKASSGAAWKQRFARPAAAPP